MEKKLNIDLRYFCELRKHSELEKYFEHRIRIEISDLPLPTEEGQMMQYTVKKHYLDAEEVFRNYVYWMPIQSSKDFSFNYKGYFFDDKKFDTKQLVVDYIKNELKPYEYIIEYNIFKLDEEK